MASDHTNLPVILPQTSRFHLFVSLETSSPLAHSRFQSFAAAENSRPYANPPVYRPRSQTPHKVSRPNPRRNSQMVTSCSPHDLTWGTCLLADMTGGHAKGSIRSLLLTYSLASAASQFASTVSVIPRSLSPARFLLQQQALGPLQRFVPPLRLVQSFDLGYSCQPALPQRATTVVLLGVEEARLLHGFALVLEWRRQVVVVVVDPVPAFDTVEAQITRNDTA